MNIAVVGLGFVGLSLSSVLASKNNNVIGIDIDNQKCLEIRNGVLPLFEPDLEKTLRIGLKKKLIISNNFFIFYFLNCFFSNKINIFFKTYCKFQTCFILIFFWRHIMPPM